MTVLDNNILINRRMAKERRQVEFGNCPKYDGHEMSEAQILKTAKKAVEIARNEMYSRISNWMMGIMALMALNWLSNHGYIK